MEKFIENNRSVCVRKSVSVYELLRQSFSPRLFATYLHFSSHFERAANRLPSKLLARRDGGVCQFGTTCLCARKRTNKHCLRKSFCVFNGLCFYVDFGA